MKLDAHGASHLGKHRQNQEDSFHVGDGLYIIADGMGGHEGGEVASAIAVRSMLRASDGDLVDSIIAANESVIATSITTPGLSGMGTTVVAARWDPNARRLTVSHVGDSRAYYFCPGRGLKQVTRDHNKNGYLTQCLGGGIFCELKPSKADISPSAGSYVVLCSDGLTSEVENSAIRDLLRVCSQHHVSAEMVTEVLIALCLNTPARDNVTVVCIRF